MTLIDHGYYKEFVADRAAPAAQPLAARAEAPTAAPTTLPGAPRASAYGIGGGSGQRSRVSQDADGAFLTTLTSVALRAPLSAENDWRALDLDSMTLSRMSPARLLELLSDLSPEVSRALWDFLRFANGGWEATALRPNGTSKAPKTQQAVLDAIIARIAERHGAFDVVLNRLYLGAFLRGAFVGELVLDSNARQALDIATPDPASIEFEARTDEAGPRYVPGQRVRGQFVALDIPTFRYVPIDPFPGRPYGRAPAAPALFASLFLLGLLHDLRRVVAQQGYPRLDVSISVEKLHAMMPEGLDDAESAAWVASAIREVQAAYASLEPDDTYIHLDVVEVKRPVGALDSSSLGAVDGLVSALERMLVKALKTVPIMQGITDGVAEANVRVQWKIYRTTLRVFQHMLEQLLDYLLTLALQAEGVAAVVEFRFATVDITDRYIDAQTEQLTVQNAAAMYAAGWISQDDAARRGAGVEKADQPGPRSSSAGGTAAPAAVDVPPGVGA